MIRQLDLFDGTSNDLFLRWVHTAHGRAVMDRFIKLAWGLRQRGVRHYGAKGIVERLRWHYMIVKGADGFKINNNWTSRLSRYAEAKEPRLRGLFEKRALRT
jgi:hypothetical protein